MLKKLILASMVSILTACGFNFQNGQLIPLEMQTLTLESHDSHSEMSVAMRKQLLLNNVNLVEAKANIPVLRLNKITASNRVASVFKQGREAESILILEVEATVRLPNKEPYSIMAVVNRTFFDNSRAALAKYAEKEVIWNDMYEQAARQLMSKMVALQQQIK